MFCFCSAAGPAASGTQNFNKRAVSSVSGSQEEESGVPCITGSLPSSTLARQWGVAQEHPSCPFVEPGKGSSTQAPATSRHTQAGLLCFPPHEEESGECYTTHPDPAPCHHRPGLHRPRAGSLCSTSLPHHGYVPLARSLGAWLAIPSPSRWLLRTIRLGYAIQFARRPPKFRGIRFTSVKAADAPVLHAEIAVLLAKDAIEPVPPADMGSGLFSPYFIVPKKGGGLRPILDLRVLNHALHKLPFKMLTQKHIFGCVRPLDWFAAIDLKDAYFHVSILPRHRPFLRFAFEGRAYQYKVLPFGLSLSPRVFTKVMEAAFVPLREQGVRILNYLDDWLILAQSRRQLSAHRDLVLKHLSLLGLRVNWEKSKLVPMQRISFLGMEFDLVNQTARLTQKRAQSVLNCFKTLSGKTAVPLKLFQRLLGHMAAAAVTVPLGLLHMRPLQHWLYGRIPRWAWKHGTYRVQITPACRKVRSLVPSGRSAPGAGIQTCCGIHRCLDHRLGSHVQWARSIRGLDGPPTALTYQLPRVASSTPCPEPSQRAPSAQGRSGPYRQHCDRCVCQPARRRCSIRAVLSFLQQRLERRLSPSTLKVYVAAISTHHDPVEGKSVGKHNLVVRFLRGARRLNPPRPPSLPSWDLALVLRALITAPFEPLQSVELKFLSMKILLLTALASIKRVGDLQAFSADDSCLEFGPADSSATLRPRPGYVPKVPTTPFRDQVVNLQALPPEEADPALALLCPVRALRQYTDRTQSFRTSEQLFVCYGGQ